MRNVEWWMLNAEWKKKWYGAGGKEMLDGWIVKWLGDQRPEEKLGADAWS